MPRMEQKPLTQEKSPGMHSVSRLLVSFTLFGCIAPTAQAIPPFYKQFAEMYGGEDSALPELDRKQACFVCHQGKKKKNRNAYGEALSEHLTKKDKADVEKIIAALETVATQSSNPEEEGAPTFGELITAGELPGGSLEQSMLEPEELE